MWEYATTWRPSFIPAGILRVQSVQLHDSFGKSGMSTSVSTQFEITAGLSSGVSFTISNVAWDTAKLPAAVEGSIPLVSGHLYLAGIRMSVTTTTTGALPTHAVVTANILSMSSSASVQTIAKLDGIAANEAFAFEASMELLPRDISIIPSTCICAV